MWLLLSSSCSAGLRERIEQLSDRFGTPRFEPHITILSGLLGNEKMMARRAAEVANRLQTGKVLLEEIGYRQDYFRCLFVRVEKSGFITTAHAVTKKIFGVESARVYMPHVSLMYGDLPVPRKKTLIAELGSDLNLCCMVERIRLVSTRGRPDEWYPAAEFVLRTSG